MMRRKRIDRMKRAGALLLVIGTLCVLPVSATAESRSTSASVHFTSEPSTGPIPPVDPDRPGSETPISPDRPGQEEAISPARPESETVVINGREIIPASEWGTNRQVPGATGAAGWLAINYVTPLNYAAEIEDGFFTVQQERPYLQTSDLRGTATGWKVTAIAGPFHDPETMSPARALLSFYHGSPNSANLNLRPPNIPEMIELPANGRTQQLVEFAHESEGVGIWVARWYPQNGVERDCRLRLFSLVSDGRLGFVLWIMNDAP